MKVHVILLGFVITVLGGVAIQRVTLVSAQEGNEPATRTANEELGRLLFWDPILSGDRDIACATCYHPDFAYADGRPLSLGPGSVGLGPARTDTTNVAIPVVKRNFPTVLNVGFNGLDDNRWRRQEFDGTVASVNQENAPMFWDNRLRSLELQALEPIKAFEEMRGPAYPEDAALDVVVARLEANPEYVGLFEHAFGTGAPVTPPRIGQAIAAYERTLTAMNSPIRPLPCRGQQCTERPAMARYGRIRRCGLRPVSRRGDVLRLRPARGRRGRASAAAGRGCGRRPVSFPDADASQRRADSAIHA